MKRIFAFILISFTTFGTACSQTNEVNWTKDQLEQPAELAARINNNADLPVIINVGPGAIIPHSADAGMAESKEGISKLKSIIKDLPKDQDIVIYCGCCPFAHCPNVRPAIEVLKQQQFTNYHLLNLPQNINVDWIAKGYPVIKK